MADTDKKVTIIPANEKVQPKVDRPLRVAAYARVSTSLAEQLTSYNLQVAYYTDLILKKPEWQLVKVYADYAKSGTTDDKRNGFLSMIQDCRKGKIDFVITKSVPRLSRNIVDCLDYVRELKSLGIPVYFERENLNTMEQDSELQLAIHASLAQSESESISRNIKWSTTRSFASGKVRFSYNHWLGYKKGEDGLPEIIPSEAKTVLQIFEQYLEGHSSSEIAKQLSENEIPHKAGAIYNWQSSTILRILNNERYCGDAISQKTYTTDCLSHKARPNKGELPKYYVENSHKGIITRQTYEQAQAEIARRRSMRKPDNAKSKYSSKLPLTGLIFCGRCKSRYKRITWCKRGRKKRVWRCECRAIHGLKYCSSSPTIEEYALEEALANFLIEEGIVSPLHYIAEDKRVSLRNELNDSCDSIICSLYEVLFSTNRQRWDELKKQADRLYTTFTMQLADTASLDLCTVRDNLLRVEVMEDRSIIVITKTGMQYTIHI